ncbi:hypothetical protein LW858_02965 [Bacillus cereus]|nr:hypothetical protein [Bacillus cereus]UIJ67268.1 hypothetical protein LW858_02965 [Bacillus cereus]
MNKKVKQFKYFMIILACIAIFGTIGTCLLFSITYFLIKKAILRRGN